MSTRSHGAIAVLAVLAVTAVLVTGCGLDDGDRTAPTAETSATAPASTAPAGPVAWVDGLPIGPPPSTGYVIGHTYHSPDGRTVRLPQDRGITAIAGLGDGFLVVDDRNFEATVGVALLDSRGRRVRDFGTMTGVPALSADGATLRWITFSGSEEAVRRPTRLHVADVATGEIRSRAIRRHGEIRPMVPRQRGLPVVWVKDGALVVLDQVTREQVARLASPGHWIRGRIWSAAWEDRAHLLVSFQRDHGLETTILRVDVRSGDWSLAVDWTPTNETHGVTFQTAR